MEESGMAQQLVPSDLEEREIIEKKSVAFIDWTAAFAGAFVAAALSFVLLSFGTAIGLAVASPSSTWRDTSSVLALLGGLWLLLASLASFGLGGYIAGNLRSPWAPALPHQIEFRDGIHGLLVWGIAILLGAILAVAATRTVAPRSDITSATSTASEPLLAFELDRLFRSDRNPVSADDSELRAQASRIITSGLGHSGIAADDRAYLVQMVAMRTGLAQQEAESRVDRAFRQSSEAISRARHAAVILAFMIAASLMIGAAVSWLAASVGGQHRDTSVAHGFWRRWDVDRMFFIR
jgi:hypothetical protein